MPNSELKGRMDEKSSGVQLKLTSPSFADGAVIPKRHTADGDDASPRLTWSDVPPGTECFALMCEDPDAPSGPFVHWLVWNIPKEERELNEEVPRARQIADMSQGDNGFGNVGYGGPSPPPGKPHRYVFRLYALDERIDLPAGSKRADFERAIEAHTLAEATLIGMYGR